MGSNTARLFRQHAVLLSFLTLVGLLVAGCGGSSGDAVVAHGATTTDAAPSTPVNAMPTTPVSVSSNSPELILCREEQPDSPQLVALAGSSQGVSVTQLVSFSGADQTTTCSVSPDLTKLAELSTTSEGSKVAGYLSAGGGGFVNVSGHETNGYSGVAHIDEEPLFDPVSGELWWISAGDIWSSALNGAKPQNHGAGQVAAFTATGEPRAYRWSQSPDGSVEAFGKELEEIHYSQGLGVAIARSSDVTASCEDRVAKDPSPEGAGASDFLNACPGVARVAFETTCDSFVGLISDSEFICGLTEANGQRFYRVAFTIDGDQVKIVSHVQLTPATTMKIGWVAVSPDGKELWYLATSGATTPESTEQTKLYIVPTGGPTSEPSPVMVTPETSLAAASLKGWRWKGRWLDGAP
jgi:hypothetical protein